MRVEKNNFRIKTTVYKGIEEEKKKEKKSIKKKHILEFFNAFNFKYKTHQKKKNNLNEFLSDT